MIAAIFAVSAAKESRYVWRFASKVALPAGSICSSASATARATLGIVAGSYQTCAFEPSVRPSSAWTLTTLRSDRGEAAIRWSRKAS